MAFRGGRGGRGGGRFRRGGWGGYPAKHAPHENFPEITLPEMTCAKATNEEKALILSTLKFEEFLRHSCYHLEEDAPKKRPTIIEKLSWGLSLIGNVRMKTKRLEDFLIGNVRQTKREALASYLKLTPANFPAELLQGFRRGQLSNKKLRWDRDSDEHAFDVFEKLEQNQKDGEKKTEKDGDDEDDQEEEEVEEDESSDDDYNQNIEFDDDDDDWNQEAEAHEDYYD